MSKIDKTELIKKLRRLDGLTNEEKSNLIGLLRQHKKYGLVWEDKPENVGKTTCGIIPASISRPLPM